MKIEELLQKGRNRLIENKIEDANVIARVLFQYVLQYNRTEFMLKQSEEIQKEQKQEYERLIQKIIEGTPLQYIINTQEFYGLNFYVDQNVLIPQPDTEILVEEVLEIAKKENKNKLLDMCTGSGCIGISLAYYLEKSKITVSDISKEALTIAKRNAKANEVLERVTLVESNLFEKIEETFEMIVLNPPYIETNVIPMLPKQVQQEPLLALDGGEDGLMFYRKVVQEAPKYLKEGGYLCMEIGYNQKDAVIKLLEENKNYKQIYSKKDLSQNDRIIIAKR